MTLMMVTMILLTDPKKTHTDSKKEKIKPKMYFAGGGIK